MATLLVVVGVIALFALAPFVGIDSRVDDERDRRR
jgi:hypothetical protein